MKFEHDNLHDSSQGEIHSSCINATCEWYIGRFVIKKQHQKDNMLETYWTIQGSTVNTIRRAYVIT